MDSSANRENEGEAEEEKGILYEFITHAEWPQEAELMIKSETSVWKGKRSAVFLNSFWSKLSSLTSYLSPDVINVNNSRLAWHLAAGVEGRLVAILQDSTFEIRSSKDDYATVVGTNSVKRDLNPHWRRMAWSPDSNFLAISYSDGALECFDSTGIKLFSTNSLDSTSYDLGEALVEIMFIDQRVKTDSKWAYELVVINYKGHLRSYFISRLEHELSHTFSFKQAVTAALYHPKFNVIFCCGLVGGSPSYDSEETWSAGWCGISTWRLLNDLPYYRLSLTIEQEMNQVKSNFFQHISKRVLGRRSKDEIGKLVLSPNGSYLVSVHVSGTISVWNVPSMRLWNKWTPDQQPTYEQDSTFGSNRKMKSTDSKLVPNHVIDLSWWSDKAVIIGRYNGGVSVSSISSNLKNLLGGSVEWFESQPQLTAAFDNRFLVLECEHQVVTRRPTVTDTDPDDEELQKAENSSDEEADSSSNMLKSALFYITDNEKFRPHRKKHRLTVKTYRLICLKSTTPEELFLSKLDDEQFGEALALAKTYGLDCDLVYQRQWRNSGFTSNDIQDYLSKITKRSWVLQECLERVPQNIDAMRALLQFGLLGTNIKVLMNIGKGIDSGKFILDVDDVVDDGEDSALDAEPSTVKHTKCLVDDVDFLNLTADQKHLCWCRMKMLQYLDRLTTYEVMLGGPAYSYETYDAKFFSIFRSQPAVEATIEFAHQSNWQGVSAMLTFHGKETLPHRLGILSNFPETTSPGIYRSLLPEAGFCEAELYVYKWEEENVRDYDWVESAACMEACGFEVKVGAALPLYEERPNLTKYIDFEKSPPLLTTWYIERAFEIEENCRLISHAQELLRLGMERNVQNLEDLYDELATLEVLVYERGTEESITLKQLQSLSNIEKFNLLMSSSTKDDIVKNMKLWAIPFLSRCEKKSPGSSRELMREYMIELSVHRLDSCANLFRAAPHQQHFVTQTTTEFMGLALDCIYSCEGDQLESAVAIFESLPHRGFGIIPKELEIIHDRVNQLEYHLNAAKLLKKHDISKSIAYIRRCESDENEIKNLLKLLTRVSCRKDSSFGEAELKELLEDIIKLQSSVFYCVDVIFCVEIFVESLLSSGRSDYIQVASSLLKSKAVGHQRSGQSSLALYTLLPQQQTIPKDRSIHLLISAAKEYFNSSSEMEDPIMSLARQCLKLVDQPDENVLSELDLIDSLNILNHFGIKMLPLQVRMCADRLDLIRQIFDIDPSAYCESQKLMTLAHYLRVGQDVRKWEEQVLILIAKAALKANDFAACYNACQQLVSHKYSDGWEVCFDLGRCELFENVASRCDLLTFSAVYCPTDQLELVLKIKLSLKGYLLKQKMQRRLDIIKGTSKQGFPESEKSSQASTGNLTVQLQNLTASTTKQALSMISNSNIFKDASSWLRPLWQAQTSVGVDEIAGFNLLFEKLSVPCFYSSFVSDSLESPLSTSYRSYAIPREMPNLAVSFDIMSLVMLTWSEESSDKLSLSPHIIQQLVTNLLPLDSTLGLACLMTLSDPTAVDECFKNLPNTDTCVQLAIYLFSLRICQLAELIRKAKLYSTDSETLFKRAERYARLHSKTIEDPALKSYCECLQHYMKKREDFAQARMLLSLGRGVDVVRFGCDEQYRFETVLGLVMTTDDKVFNIAVSLAERYQMNQWELYMTHLEYLFDEEELKLPALEQRVAKLELILKLLKDVEKFKERLESRVYATIAGCDHNRLLYFYSLQLQCQPNNSDERSALLKKLRPLTKGLDFKALMNNKGDVLSVLKPALNSSNVKKLAKMAPQISKCCHQQLSSSGIYRIFALKCFMENATGKSTELTKETGDWISRYNVCKDYFEFLDPSDFTKFLDEALFTEGPFDEMPQDIRVEVLNRSLKFAKQELSRCKEGSSLKSEWEEAVNFVNQAKNHMSWLQSENIANLTDIGDDVIKGFLQELKFAHSNDKLKVLLLRYVIDGYPGEVLQQLFSICPPSISLQMSELITEAFSIVIACLSKRTSRYSHLLADVDVVSVLKKMLDSIICSQTQVISLDNIMGQLESVYKDDSIETGVRLKLIEVLEKVYEKSDETLKLIRNYKLKVMVTQTWPGFKISDDILQIEEIKETTFIELLSNSRTLEQGECLVKILISWPTLSIENSSDISINPWCRIMRFMLSTKTEGSLDSVIRCLRLLQNRTSIEIEGIEPIFNEINECGRILHTLKFSLLTKHEKLHKQVLEYLKQSSEETNLELDEETCNLLIEHQLVPQTICTVLFKPLVEYIIKRKDINFVKKLAGIIHQNGYPLEASSLLMKKTATVSSLQTFSSALGLMKRWL